MTGCIGKLVDVHVHSTYSMDSRMTIDSLCNTAIEKGLAGICITDHVEHNPVDIGFGKYRLQEYFDDISRAQDKYGDKLLILSGIEFSEPHRYPREFEQFALMPYDCIIGSVHYWIGDIRVEDMVESIPLDEAFDSYWKAVKDAVSLGGFNVLGHLDFPKRFYRGGVWNKEQISEIFKLMLKNRIVPEINTSSLRLGIGETMPNMEMLKLYNKLGGNQVTLGSDAHDLDMVGRDLDAAYCRAAGFEIGYFQGRIFKSV